ncbi:MAG: MerR family transcriptional regulator, repressor of the yfmOP operon [Solirubrobacteraceae bacterium]
MSGQAVVALRIGEVARRVGTTPRTIRYYEEIGLLPGEDERESGRHRVYGERDVERLRDALRLKELLGVSLEELKELLEAEGARAAIRDEWRHGEPDAARRRALLDESLGHLDRQLALVRRRRDEIAALESDLAATRRRVLRRRRELRGS